MSNVETCSEGVGFVRVKDKYAALWPFLGIVAEVVVLLTVILVSVFCLSCFIVKRPVYTTTYFCRTITIHIHPFSAKCIFLKKEFHYQCF
jgi:hypothetical protein